MTVAYDYKKRTSPTPPTPTRRRRRTRSSKEYAFEPSLPLRGYTNRTLHVDLDTLEMRESAVTQQMKDVFIGGRGFGLYYLWHAVTPTTKWNDPENVIVISPGPLSGNTQYAGSGKSLVVTLSPLTGIPDRQQRRRLLRSAHEVLRASTRFEIKGKAPQRRRARDRRPEGHRHDRGGARGDTRQPHRGRALHARVRRRAPRTSATCRWCRPAWRPSTAASAASTSRGGIPNAARRGSSRPGAAASARCSATRS